MSEKRGFFVLSFFFSLALLAAMAPAMPIDQQHQLVERRGDGPTVTVRQLGTETNPIYIKALPTDDHWSTSDKIAVGALVSALLQFIALVWTVVVAKRNGRRQLRAYVAVAERSLIFDTQTTLTCVLKIKNFGQTPAFEVEECLYAWVDTYPTPTEVPECTFGPSSEQMYLPPTGEFQPYMEVSVSDTELDEILASNKAVWAIGAIRFVDAFGYHLETPFRYFMTGEEFIGPDRKMNIAPTGNHPRRI